MYFQLRPTSAKEAPGACSLAPSAFSDWPSRQHGFRPSRRGRIARRDLEILLGRLAMASALEMGLAQPEDGVGHMYQRLLPFLAIKPSKPFWALSY